jgi:hypothetical protein
MRIVEINTTAYDEENFLIITDLTDEEITFVLKPIIDKERYDCEDYDNLDLLDALIKAYPDRLEDATINKIVL